MPVKIPSGLNCFKRARTSLVGLFPSSPTMYATRPAYKSSMSANSSGVRSWRRTTCGVDMDVPLNTSVLLLTEPPNMLVP